MKARFWGVRGSVPTPGPRTARYGGNTACVEVRAGGQLLIIDSGTGARELGQALLAEAAGKPIAGSFLIGHTHWDHIQGFPFFTPLYLPTSRFTVRGVSGTTRSFLDVMAGQMSSTYFPVQLGDMASKPEFVEFSGPTMIGPVKVGFHYLNHPGITIGFRLEHEGKVLGYISDHEPYGKLNARSAFTDKEDAAIARFVEGADLLICESQYTADEYRLKRGWGHSTFDDVLDLATRAGVKRLALFHHDPAHDDDAMDAHEAACVKAIAARGARIDVFAAREGMEVEL